MGDAARSAERFLASFADDLSDSSDDDDRALSEGRLSEDGDSQPDDRDRDRDRDDASVGTAPPSERRLGGDLVTGGGGDDDDDDALSEDSALDAALQRLDRRSRESVEDSVGFGEWVGRFV